MPGQASWRHFRELRLLSFLLFFSRPSRKASVYSIADSKMERTDTSIYSSARVFYHTQEDQVEGGRCRAPSLSTISVSGLWTRQAPPWWFSTSG